MQSMPVKNCFNADVFLTDMHSGLVVIRPHGIELLQTYIFKLCIFICFILVVLLVLIMSVSVLIV